MTAAVMVLALAVALWPSSFRRLPGEERAASSAPRWLVPACCVLLAAGAAWWFGGIWAVSAAAMAGGTGRRRYRRRLERDRRADELNWLATGVEVIIGELRVGSHPATASAVAADECGGIASTALRGAASRSRLGGMAADGIASSDSLLDPELGRLAAAWRVADEHGLALAELLDAVREDLLGRRRFRERTDASLAGARATALVLAGLPILGVALGQLMGADPLDILLGGGLGGMLLLIGTALGCAGLLWTDAITGKVTT
ncbi:MULTISPECIES: type II secretion system F family protein [unclassified Rhodococcus (in: high G+C Gram-positive bacteria)]|uniref:type II secretion system F family protein n=1 Tax=unclassified Rhodococcus (in: high G+C Gram-positive bacteria) TaxID=192944 RepID=UPI002952C306|nr:MULTISPECIES: type II secretion system F family protein [unclassified Rhodococcus (in: high G+C Gram-positive bacteria)]MDV8055641.1 secretion protein F [Rhodococcus sp. IEGM 1343]MDV8078340.1 secretion protein F [Rhodococcus sp. IEGM 1370]